MIDDDVNPALEALMATRPNMPTEVLDDLAALFRRPAWHQDAACRGAGPGAFYPERGESLAPAREVCSTCTVIDACLEAALTDDGPQFGVWAGLSPAQRTERRRLIRSAVTAPRPDTSEDQPAASVHLFGP